MGRVTLGAEDGLPVSPKGTMLPYVTTMLLYNIEIHLVN